MGLPRSEQARIDQRKISNYLLSPTHPVGRHKHRFFLSVGFSSDRAEDLVATIRQVAQEGVVRGERATRYGRKYIVDGRLAAPIGGIGVRTVWIVREGGRVPQFVTAFPHSLPEEEP